MADPYRHVAPEAMAWAQSIITDPADVSPEFRAQVEADALLVVERLKAEGRKYVEPPEPGGLGYWTDADDD